jgi:hypothetical protein
MKAIYSIGSVLLVSAVLAAGYSLGHRAQGADPKTPQATAASTSQSDRNIEQLAEQLSSTQRRLASLESAGAREDQSASSAQPEARPAPAPPSAEEIDRRQAERVEQIEVAVQAELRDASWAPGFEKEIRQAIQVAGEGATYTVKSVTCRTSICRMEISHPDQQGQYAFLQQFQHNLPDVAVSHLQPTQGSDGSFATVAHFVRKGYPMPGSEAFQANAN